MRVPFHSAQGVEVDGAPSESILIVSGVLLGNVLFILCTSEMVKHRLFTYAEDCTLLAVARKPVTDFQLLPPLINRDLAMDSGVMQSLVHDSESCTTNLVVTLLDCILHVQGLFELESLFVLESAL